MNFMVTCYKFKKLIGSNDFSHQFRKNHYTSIRYNRMEYNLNVIRPPVCLVLTQSWLNSLFPGGSDARLYDVPDLKCFMSVGWDRSFFSFA